MVGVHSIIHDDVINYNHSPKTRSTGRPAATTTNHHPPTHNPPPPKKHHTPKPNSPPPKKYKHKH